MRMRKKEKKGPNAKTSKKAFWRRHGKKKRKGKMKREEEVGEYQNVVLEKSVIADKQKLNGGEKRTWNSGALGATGLLAKV